MTEARGFTLVELIIVMVIIGVIAAVVAVFITGPISGYVDVMRRAQLSDAADTTLRRISRDLRQALPNSVRVDSNNRFLEYIPTSNGSRYLVEVPDILDFTTADSSFGFLGETIAATGFIVVFNTGQVSSGTRAAPGCVGADAYEGCNRSAGTAAGNLVSLTAPFKFPFASPSNRFHILPASGPVTLACEGVAAAAGNGSGTLKIYTGYKTGGDWGSAAPTPPGGATSTSLLAQYVSACTFTYTSGITASNGLVTLRLALTRNNETVTLHHQVHVDNSP